MTIIKHLLAVLVALLVSLPSWSADGDMFYANISENVDMRFQVISESEKTCQVGCPGYSTVSPEKYEGRITIPSSVNGYKVSSIGGAAFSGCSGLTSINIPEGVTSIGSLAFSGCSGLTSINIPEGVMSIGDYAFARCSGLTSINIPEGVTSIGPYAFSGCSGLTSINISEGVTSIESCTFYECSSLSVVEIPTTVSGIGTKAFYGCSSLTNLTIPESVTSFSDHVFQGCSNLTSISLPSSPSYFYSGSLSLFEGCTNLPVENNIRYAGNWALEVIDKTQMNYSVREGTTFLGGSLFSGCSDLMKVTLPSSLKGIGDYAFDNCSGLLSISFPSEFTYIMKSAFRGCSSLTSISFPGAINLAADAFSGCYNIKRVEFHSIADLCESQTYGQLPIYIDLYIDGEQATDIIIPSSITNINQGAFQGFKNIKSVIIGENVTSIGSGAFSRCSGLTSITIPEGVTSIGYQAFYMCDALNSVTIPSSLTSIGDGAFGGCTGLISATVNCGNISKSGFLGGFPLLKEATIGDKMSVIYNAMFSGCSSLEKVTIGSAMEFIRTDAFKGCTSINTIECNAEVPPYCYPNVFADIDVPHCKLYVPEESVDAYANDEQWGAFDIVGLSFPSSIDLTDGETFEGYNRFLDMEQITYSRTFKNTSWQAWYVPFEVELTSDLLSRFSFAKYAGTYVDENSDPSFFITIARLKAGDKLKANTPYFVQAKTASNTAQVISVANTTLKPAQETGFDMYSAEQKVSIRGVYSAKTATAGDCDWYAYGGGSYFKATAGAVLNPYRVYLTITERDDNPYGTSEAPNEIKVKLLGDDGATIIEEVQGAEEVQDAPIYDLSGRRIMKDKLDKGIYIINGKKVLVK